MELFALYTLKYLTTLQNLDLDADKNFYWKPFTVAMVIITKLRLDEAWIDIHENYKRKFASSRLQLLNKFGRSRYPLRLSNRLVSLSLLFQ